MGAETGSVMKEERERKRQNNTEVKAAWWACLVLALASVSGGLVLGWWVVRLHASQKQQWMVPFSLVLMITPIFLLISAFISSFCTSTDTSCSSVSSLDLDRPHETRC